MSCVYRVYDPVEFCIHGYMKTGWMQIDKTWYDDWSSDDDDTVSSSILPSIVKNHYNLYLSKQSYSDGISRVILC